MKTKSDREWMQVALRLARRGYGLTSPNPLVGAILVRQGKILGRGWHRQAGKPHAEIEALRAAQRRGHRTQGATLYVTLEPCCTHGRTPPCTEAILAAGIKHVVVGATDPNPKHAGRGFKILRQARVKVISGILASECTKLNESFNHWIIRRIPLVTVKAAMTLDGKIATTTGESKWITGEKARTEGMRLRTGADAILVGINTILADDPSLTVRPLTKKPFRRIVLDSMARTPLTAKVVTDKFASSTTIVVGKTAPKSRVTALSRQVKVVTAPLAKSKIDLRWLLKKLGREAVTSLLVEGGGEVNASFLFQGFARRVSFFYAPKILSGRDARKAVAGAGIFHLADALQLEDVEWRQLGTDLHLSARVKARQG